MEGKKLDYKIDQFASALKNFKDSLDLKLENFADVTLDTIESGQIQKFEICAELMWKTIKKLLEDRGVLGKTAPRDIINSFVEAKYCDYELHAELIKILEDRNALSHIYNVDTAQEIRRNFSEYYDVFDQVLEVLRGL